VSPGAAWGAGAGLGGAGKAACVSVGRAFTIVSPFNRAADPAWPVGKSESDYVSARGQFYIPGGTGRSLTECRGAATRRRPGAPGRPSRRFRAAAEFSASHQASECGRRARGWWVTGSVASS
jgi:hypothetical protein